MSAVSKLKPKCTAILMTKTVRPYTTGDIVGLTKELAQKYIDKGYATLVTEETHPEEFERWRRKETKRRARKLEHDQAKAAEAEKNRQILEKAAAELDDEADAEAAAEDERLLAAAKARAAAGDDDGDLSDDDLEPDD